MNGVKERLLEYIKSIGIPVAEFERKIGVGNGYVKNISKSIQPDKLEIISNLYPSLNIEWLLLGKGVMTIGNEANYKKEGIPHIESVDAWCGKGQGFEVSVMKKDCPLYNIPGVEEADFTIRAKGRSMINRQHPTRSIREGDYVACKKPCTNVIRYGEIYALATSEGVMVKVVRPCNKEGFITLESFNTEEGYEPFEFPIVDIHDMALVVATVSINLLA